MLLTITDCARDLAAGCTTSRALTERALEKIVDPAGEGGRTFIKVYRDAALAEAEASDQLRKHGVVPSPLAGIPISIKDLFDVAGDVTLAGAKVLADEKPAQRDAPIVARLRAAGAVIIGRTNLSPMAFSPYGLNPDFGVPGNPADRKRIPGGSSSGAAVSVCDGMAIAAIGSDTGGSIRIPAAFCGLTGLKPTQNRVPLDGTWPLSTSLDSIGPLAASVACCALVDAVLAADSSEVPAAMTLAGLRLGLPQTLLLDGLDDTVGKAFARALSRLAEKGARIVEAPLPELAEPSELNKRPGISQMEGYTWHRKWLAEKGERYDPRVRSRLEVGAKCTASDYIELLRTRQDLIARAASATAAFDAVIMPTIAVVAPAIASLASDEDYRRHIPLIIRNTHPANFLDRCAISLPCHQAGELPVGLTLMGEHGADKKLIAMALAVEQALAR